MQWHKLVLTEKSELGEAVLLCVGGSARRRRAWKGSRRGITQREHWKYLLCPRLSRIFTFLSWSFEGL